MRKITMIDRTELTIEANLALDEAMLLAAEAGDSAEVLRFWEWPRPAVVLGAGGSVMIDVNAELCRADGVPILRRPSGGGTVLLGRGCQCFSLVLAYERALELRQVNVSYRWILGRVSDSLRDLAAVQLSGISDLAIGERKFSGNAQQRKAKFVLHHGTLLYDFDLPAVGRYLRSPEREPAYREGRDHDSFVANFPAKAETLKERIAAAFDAIPGDIDATVLERAPALIAERYSKAEWNERR